MVNTPFDFNKSNESVYLFDALWDISIQKYMDATKKEKAASPSIIINKR